MLAARPQHSLTVFSVHQHPLQPCLGGTARTAILATINPSHLHVEETLNTLQFAHRTMNVVNTVIQNRIGTYSKGSSKEQVRGLTCVLPLSSSSDTGVFAITLSGCARLDLLVKVPMCSLTFSDLQEAAIAALRVQVAQLQGQLKKVKGGEATLGALSEQQLQDLEVGRERGK